MLTRGVASGAASSQGYARANNDCSEGFRYVVSRQPLGTSGQHGGWLGMGRRSYRARLAAARSIAFGQGRLKPGSNLAMKVPRLVHALDNLGTIC